MHSPIMPTLTPFLASVLEGLVDGIVITNFHGQVLYLNSIAQDLCQNWLASEHRHYRLQAAAGVSVQPTDWLAPSFVTHPAWSICEVLKDQSDRALNLEGEMLINQVNYRIRVQRLDVNAADDPVETCFIIRFENQNQSSYYLATLEAQQFGLTARETEVWQMQCQNRSRREIATALQVSTETVKKHLGNIRLKRQHYLDRYSQTHHNSKS